MSDRERNRPPNSNTNKVLSERERSRNSDNELIELPSNLRNETTEQSTSPYSERREESNSPLNVIRELVSNSQTAQRSVRTETVHSGNAHKLVPIKLATSRHEDHGRPFHTEEIEMRYKRSAHPKSCMIYFMTMRMTMKITPALYTTTTEPDPTPELTTYGIKLGWVQGVLVPCLLNIWGVMLFLRIAWIVAQAGIACCILIIFISSVVCVITTLSLSAICTNGQVQGGGVYYLVSRSLGAELGASVGIIFAFANAVAASMNTIGFCESFNELLKSYDIKIIDNSVNDIRIVGAIALLIMCLICAVGMDWETKTQNFLIVIIVTAITNYIIGSFMGPTTDKAKAEGFQGISLELARDNWTPDFRTSQNEEHNFFSVFAMYFPAVTGVQAGANICGDLRDPASAIPKGTLLALAISTTSYVIMATLSGAGALRDASGNITVAANPDALGACKPNCEYGLHNNYEIMHLMALWGPLIYGGCWAATLSTALTNLLSVPRLIQALGIDQIYPGLIYFSKPYGKHGEPYRGYVLVFFISLLFLLIADLNRIAPLITNFYLASYALINFCTFHAAYIKPISWRPKFQFFNMWLSLSGFIICAVIMMIISWVMAVLTTFIFLFLYLIVLYRKPETNWEGSADVQRYQDTIAAILHISNRNVNTIAYNPQLLVMAGELRAREWLICMGKLITSIGSFMIVADIQSTTMTASVRRKRIDAAEKWLREHKSRAFYVLIHSVEYEQGLRTLLQSAGLGRLKPNIMLVGYKYDWRQSVPDELAVYFRSLQLAFNFGLAVAILRVSRVFRHKMSSSLAYSRTTETSDRYLGEDKSPAPSRMLAVMPEDSNIDQNLFDDGYSNSESVHTPKLHIQASSSSTFDDASQKPCIFKPLDFHPNSTLDAWWLYDDGGMNMLLPYIIARRSSGHNMALRIFTLPQTGLPLEDSYVYMQNLLAKFRIEYSKLTLVEGINTQPSQSTSDLFTSFTRDLPVENKDDESKFLRMTTRHMRLRELMLEHSFAADFIVMTLPYPRENHVTPTLYMAWLEIMSKDLPPLMFVRGNQETHVIGP